MNKEACAIGCATAAEGTSAVTGVAAEAAAAASSAARIEGIE